MKGRGSVGLLLAVLVCSACTASASKLGAYIGCFDIAKSGWISGTPDFSKVSLLLQRCLQVKHHNVHVRQDSVLRPIIVVIYTVPYI